MEAHAKCRRLAADREVGELGLVVIDYLQLMKGSPNTQSREQEISEISRNLKGLAKEHAVPVVARPHISRALAGPAHKREIMNTLTYASAIELDRLPRPVLLLYQE